MSQARAPAGRPAPGPRARRPPSPRGAPGPARPAAARLPPRPRRAPPRVLGAPGQRVVVLPAEHARHDDIHLAITPAELHHPMPCAATCIAVGRSMTPHTLSAGPGSGSVAYCCACTAGCAPAWRAPHAHAPAPRQRAARPLPPPRRAPQCVLGAPGADLLSKQGVMNRTCASIQCSSSPSPLPTLPRKCRVKRVPLAVWCTHSAIIFKAGYGSAANIPVLAHAQPAARLLVKLHTLQRQRCGDALLSCCLRLGARLSECLVHLGTCAYSARHYE